MTDSSVNNSSEISILPCPFCGEVAKVGNKVSKDSNETYWVRCVNSSCPVYAETDRYDTEVEAIKAWNTRAERTCKWEPSDFLTEGEWWNTECGESFTWEPDGTPSYCPNCGAKVVDA